MCTASLRALVLIAASLLPAKALPAQTVTPAAADASTQSQLVIALSRYEVLAGQRIDVTAALVGKGPVDNTPATATLFLDGAAVGTTKIASAGTADFPAIVIGAGTHTLHATSTATATVPAAQSADAQVRGVTDPATSPGVETDIKERIQLLVDPLFNVTPQPGSQISAQVRCLLASGSNIAGELRILDNGQVIVDSQNADTAQVNATFFAAPGPHIYLCDYTNGIHSSAVGTQVVAPVPEPGSLTFELFALPDPTKYGDPILIGGAAAPFPSGMSGRIRITEGSTILLEQALDATGRATETTRTLSPGVHTLRGVFTITGAGPTFESGRSVTQTVRVAPTRISLAAKPSTGITQATPLTLTLATTSTYQGKPVSGTVTLLRNGTALGVPGVANGSVVLPPGQLPAGTSMLTARFNGGSIFGSSSSNAVTVIVESSVRPLPPHEPPHDPPHEPPTPPRLPRPSNPTPPSTPAAPLPSASDPDFKMTPANSSLTLRTGQQSDVSITMKAVNSFSGMVRLTCDDLPLSATCAFNASQYPLSSTATATLRIGASPPSLEVQTATTMRAILACALPLPLLLLLRHRKATLRRCMLLLLIAGISLAITACSMRPVPVSTYAVTIRATGTSGDITVTHTSPFRLTITPE